jgi:hypothetical protein
MLKIYRQYLLFFLEEIYDTVIQMNFYDAQQELEELISDMEIDGIPREECTFVPIIDELIIGNYGKVMDMLMGNIVDFEEQLGIVQPEEEN